MRKPGLLLDDDRIRLNPDPDCPCGSSGYTDRAKVQGEQVRFETLACGACNQPGWQEQLAATRRPWKPR